MITNYVIFVFVMVFEYYFEMPPCPECDKGFNSRSVYFCDGCGIASHRKCLNQFSAEPKANEKREQFLFCGKCLFSFDKVPKSFAGCYDFDMLELKHLNNRLKMEFFALERKLEFLETQLIARDKVLLENRENILQHRCRNPEISIPEISFHCLENEQSDVSVHIDFFASDRIREEIVDFDQVSGGANTPAVKKAAALKLKKISSPKVASPKLTNAKVLSPKLETSSTPKIASPKLNSSKADSVEDVKSKSSKAASSTTKTTNSSDSGNEGKNTKSPPLKVKLNAKSKTEKKQTAQNKQVSSVSEETSPMVGKKATPRKSNKWSQNSGSSVDIPNKPCQPCSIRCPGVQGFVPTLQCRVCLCLYHNECVGMLANINIPNYVCKNCQLEQGGQNMSTGIAPPPLTPITALQSVTAQPTALPKLQRIPKSPEADADPTVVAPTVDQDEEQADRAAETAENSSILGHVTSWLPQNSRIQVDSQQRCPNELSGPARPQYVEYLAGRKFLIIPKYNIVSVSPTVGARSSQPPQVHETVDLIPGQTADVATAVKTEPVSPSKPENSQTSESALKNVERMEVVDEDVKPLVQNIDLCSSDPPVTSESSIKTNATAKKKTIKLNNITNQSNEKTGESLFMGNYLQNLSYGYNTLLHVFQYLKVQDLLRAGCVCTMWRDIASHPSLWRTVRMKNSQVHSFEGLANTLQKHGTAQLDLRKMLLTNCDDIWPEFSSNIGKVDTLRKIELCRCPASVVENLTETNPKLEVVNAVTIRCETMNLEGLDKWENLRELRLKSTTGLTLKSDIDSLRSLTNLKILSLTSIRDLNTMKLEVIAELTNLESLDLGECTDFPENFGKDILSKLGKLEKLRLEKGQGNCHTFEIFEAVKDMDQLEQLELVNFDIKAGFDKALGACKNIKKLLIIPTYISQSATTNHMVLGGVLRLQKSLSHFVWGVTLELLRVTELFVDQCEEPDKKEKKEKKEKKVIGNGDSIPVLKPVPLISDDNSEIPPALDPPQVEILALPGLQKLLLQSLPSTRVKILKIPFHATWRQTITDAVN
ncbi:uncharacterized protein LOC123310003 isoform X2 [Coccinella septempunctata]|uniref:uncharacterized protein LOC123310003 isoform X2 n=1 Tax=Coccinella septempunctata TaxID=41139 RepID=UPI001D0725D7|nr:uncharacterized protein LOC123310003 isoform X2 [Coccinella septempunctata]